MKRSGLCGEKRFGTEPEEGNYVVFLGARGNPDQSTVGGRGGCAPSETRNAGDLKNSDKEIIPLIRFSELIRQKGKLARGENIGGDKRLAKFPINVGRPAKQGRGRALIGNELP